jgi:hypothetical protein
MARLELRRGTLTRVALTEGRDGIAEPGEFSVVEVDERGRVVGEPFAAPSELEHANTASA